MKKQNTSHSYLSIKKKLITTVAMLLVATFMVASSSYAWFTLSTAPEVTGIKTSVGSNGSLEIALNEGQTITSAVGDSGINTTWGNLIDLKDDPTNTVLNDYYGLQKIALYPSVIVVTGDTKETAVVATEGSILATPTYGADGRVESLLANAVRGKYNATGDNFDMDADAKGVTALGTASTMSVQQIEHMNAKSATSAALTRAKTTAENALSANGESLVNLVLAYANEAETYDVAAIGALLTVLAGTDAVTGEDDAVVTPAVPGVADYIEEAMTNYIVASAATANFDLSDLQFDALKQAIISACTEGSFPELVDGIAFGSYTITTIPESLKAVYEKYKAINTAITTAKSAYNTATQNGTVTTGIAKNTVAGMLDPLMVVSSVTVNGKPTSDFTAEGANLGELAAGIMQQGAVVISMPAESGVFADIATISDDIHSTFTCNVDGSSFGFPLQMEMPVNMNTDVKTFNNLATSFPNTPENRTGVTDQKLTSLYGYALDFAFRTNAAGSNLMLQTTPANRIYSSGGSTATQGGGSTMTFSVVDNTFSVDDIQKLIANIRIVFTDTTTGEILAAAALYAPDEGKAGSSITADIKLCDYELLSIGNGEDGTVKTLTFGETITFIEPDADGKTAITALDQNVEKYVSVYVYLDGQTVDNSDVAYKAVQSATGTMNLQFSSDVTLDPMDYADLMAQ